MSEPNHLERMSDVLHAIAAHRGRVEYAGQITGRVGCSEEQVNIYVATLRDSGYLTGQLLRNASAHSSRRSMDSGIRLSMSGFDHVDQRRTHIRHTLLGKSIGDDQEHP